MSENPARSPARGRVEARLARRGGWVELLRLPAALFGAAARLRGALYDRGLLPVLSLETPVVSVGNLTVGGTGKTPMVVWVVRALQDRGRRPGILSRGYRRGARGANDEARMLARLLPDVPHVQDPDRVAGGQALEATGVDVIVLDDGFQHRRLHRDLDLVLVDASRPWGLPAPSPGEGEALRALLPRGLLRETPRALGRADALVLTRADARDPRELAALRGELERLAPDLPLALARHAPSGLSRVAGGRWEPCSLEDLAGLEVDLVSGVGNPEAFEATARGLGAVAASHRAYPDHHDYRPADLAGLEQRPVLTTAKDGAKLEGAGLELYVLDVELEIVEGGEVLGTRLDGLPQGARARERQALHEGLHG